MDEPALIRRSRQGDRRAFAALVELYWDRLYRWLCRLSHDCHLAEDLAQETLVKAFTALPSFEEGTRFAPAMLASGVFAGVHEQDWAYDRTDAKGKKFGDELERIGWKGDEKVGARKMKAFFELHIEQGPILEDEGIDIGVVTHGQGLKWLQVTLTGKESHTGSTPMPKRRNAGLGMARVTELVHEVAMDPDDSKIAYISYYAGGFRVVEYGPGGIREVGAFIDQGGNNFWGVEVWKDENGQKYVLGSDRDFGLYVFRYNG